MNPSKSTEMDEQFQTLLLTESHNIHKAMASPENLPALLCGEMKHGSLYDKTGDSEKLILNGRENSQTDCNRDGGNKVDDVDSFTYTSNARTNQTGSMAGDTQQSMGKRRKLEVNSTHAPKKSFSVTNIVTLSNNVNGTPKTTQRTTKARPALDVNPVSLSLLTSK